MKVVVELSDKEVKEAEVLAAEEGLTVPEWVNDTVRQEVRVVEATDGEKPFMKGFGGLAHLREETKRIMKVIDEEFGQVDPEQWK